MVNMKRKRVVLVLGIVLLVSIAVVVALRPAAAQQRVGAHLRAAWGPVRSGYIDPVTQGLQLILEDSEGTVRIVRLYTGTGAGNDCKAGEACVDLVAELPRR
jgi:hypothetical protein